MRRFRRGDFVIYYEIPRHKATTIERGDAGIRTHFLTVRESSKKGTLVLQAHSGPLVVTHNDNPDLRRSRWWERLLYFDRFPSLDPAKQPGFGPKPSGSTAS